MQYPKEMRCSSYYLQSYTPLNALAPIQVLCLLLCSSHCPTRPAVISGPVTPPHLKLLDCVSSITIRQVAHPHNQVQFNQLRQRGARQAGRQACDGCECSAWVHAAFHRFRCCATDNSGEAHFPTCELACAKRRSATKTSSRAQGSPGSSSPHQQRE